MAKIDRVEDLPEWFQLEKYQGCESFGAVEWFARLRDRQHITSLLFDENYAAMIQEVVSPDTSRDDFIVILKDFAKPILEKMRRDPLSEYYRTDFATSELGDSLPVRHADKIAPAEKDHFAPVMVDLRASDAVLKKAFSIWLENIRADQPATQRPKAIYDRWARYGVLPYLDLSIWAWETDTHIPDRVMSAAISSYDAGEANLRKTIAPLATGLLSDLSALEAIASMEAAIHKPPSVAQLLDEILNMASVAVDPETSKD